MPIETHPFDPAGLLGSPEAQAEFLSLAFAEGDPVEIGRALGIVARAHGMAGAADIGQDEHAEFAAIVRMLSALGMRLSVQPV